MHFTKMHGAGNDFIILNNMDGSLDGEDFSALAAAVCNRHMSVGADGMMVVEPPKNGGDYAMLFYNSDGSVGEMCGNGARCICRYGYDHGLAGETQHVETTAGPVTGIRISEDYYRIRLNDATTLRRKVMVPTESGNFECTYVELGNPGLPHGITVFPGWKELYPDSLREIGRQLRWAKEFPKGANITFVDVIGKNHLEAVTFERGVEDFTLACGTGCGCTASAMLLSGLAEPGTVHISMPGGELYVDADISEDLPKDIYLTGPTKTICTGELY